MAYLDTTRTSKLYADFNFNYSILFYQPTKVMPPDFSVCEYYPGDEDRTYGWTFSGHLGFSASCRLYGEMTQPGGPGTNWNAYLYLRVTQNNGHGAGPTTNDILIWSQTAIASTTDYVIAADSVEGYHEGTVTTDVLWDITQNSAPTTIEYAIWPLYTTYNWYERSTVGTTATMKTSVTGKSSATVSSTVVSGTRPTANYQACLTAGGFSNCDDANHTFALTNVKINDKAVYDVTHNNTIGNQSATEWSYAIKGESSDPRKTASAEIDTCITLTRKCNVNGVVRSWKEAYTNNFQVDVLGFNKLTTGYDRVGGSTGTFAATETMNKYSVTTTLVDTDGDDNVLVSNLDEVPEWISAQAYVAGMNGGDSFTAPDADYIRFRGWRFNGANIYLANTYSVSGTGNDRSYNPYPNFASYRYLDIQVKRNNTGTQTFDIEITEQPGGTIKTWQLTTNSSSYETKRIDLCAPHNITANTDNQDTPYPRLNIADTANAGDEAKNLKYYGVSRVSRLRVINNANVDIGTTTLAHDTVNGYKLQNLIPSGYDHRAERITKSIVSEVGTYTQYYTRRFWHHDVDGRNEEESDVWWQKTVGGETGVTTYTLQGRTIKDLCDDINATDTYATGGAVVRHPGWTATKLVNQGSGCSVSQPALNPCFLNGDTGYATWLLGGGILCTPKVGSEGTDFTYGFETSSVYETSGKTAQTIFNRINGDFIPDRPDPFDVYTPPTGQLEDGLYLVGGVIVRGCAHGLLIDEDNLPISSSTPLVELKLATDSSIRGTDYGDAKGNYETGSPFALGGKNHNDTYTTYSIAMNPIAWSKKQKGTFRAISAIERLTSDNHWSHFQVYAVTKGGKIIIYYTYASDPSNWLYNNTGIAAQDVVLRFNNYLDSITLCMIYSESNNVYYRRSLNFNQTGIIWTMASTISTSGTRPTMVVTPTSEIYFWRTSGGNISRVVRDFVGNTIIAASDVVTGGVVADDDITAYLNYYNNKVTLLYRNTSGSIITVTSSDEGKTFS